MTKRLYESDVEQFSEWNKRLKTLLREADEKQGMEKDEEKDGDDIGQEDGEDTNPQLNKNIDEFKRIGNSLGADLYSLVAFNSLTGVWYGNSFRKPNPNIIKLLSEIGKNTSNHSASKNNWYMGNIDEDEILEKRIFILAIWNDRENRLSRFAASGKDKSIDFDSSSALISPDQQKVINKLISLTEKWQSSIPEEFPDEVLSPGKYEKMGYKKEGAMWKKNESALLNMISNKEDVSDEYDIEQDFAPDSGEIDLHAEPEELSAEEEYWWDIYQKAEDGDEEAERLWQKRIDNYKKHNDVDTGVGREKR